jgi:hypothetical protein
VTWRALAPLPLRIFFAISTKIFNFDFKKLEQD